MVTLRYLNTGSSEQSAEFNELRLYELPETDRSEGKTLRGVLFDHLLDSRRVFYLEIMKAPPTNDVLWILDFWSAEDKWISDPVTAGQFVQVVVPSGPCPLTYTEGVLNWPEITLELKAKYAS